MNILTIKSLNINGEGISYLDDKKYVVNDVLPNEEVLIEIITQKNNFVGAKLQEIKRPSPYRQLPPCKYYGICGGCNKMNVNYKACLELKKQVIKEYFADFYQGEILVFESKNQLNYRNKVSFFVKGNLIGLQKRNSNEIVEIDKCLVANSLINKTFSICKHYLSKINNDQIHHIVVRALDNCVLLSVVCKDKKPQKLDLLVDYLTKELDQKFGLYINYNNNPKKILSEKWEHICGLTCLEGKYKDMRYFVKPYSFLQINDQVKEIMYERVLSKIDNQVVIEGYSGAGLLSCIMSKKAKQVYGIEIAKSATLDAELTKKVNNITNLININGDISVVLPKLVKKHKASTFVIDPPRSGCSKIVLDIIKDCKPSKIIYISCNPYTLKQNLGYLKDDYEVESFEIFDIFPQTFDIESMVELKIKKK